MLVTFSCKVHENITVFGDVAQALLRFMGHSGAVPGAILASDVPHALNSLQQAIADIKRVELGGSTSLKSNDNDNDHEPKVSMVARAMPLIALLEDAAAHRCNVMWDVGT